MVGRISVPRKIIALMVLFSIQGNGAVTVSAPPALQSEFIANTTNQFEGTLKSGLFPGDYKITITAKKAGPPPVPETPIQTGTAFQECIAHGYAWGMENERAETLQTIDGLRSNVFQTGTCGGLVSISSVPAQAFLSGCISAYNIAGSTISLRDGIIFLPPGQ